MSERRKPVRQEFQFTHPGRGATVEVAVVLIFDLFQFTHPGRGATDTLIDDLPLGLVSIHAPREGCDGVILHTHPECIEFQFTHPGRGATIPFALC